MMSILQVLDAYKNSKVEWLLPLDQETTFCDSEQVLQTRTALWAEQRNLAQQQVLKHAPEGEYFRYSTREPLIG